MWCCDGCKVIPLCGKEASEPDTNDLCVFLYVHVGNDLQRPHVEPLRAKDDMPWTTV